MPIIKESIFVQAWINDKEMAGGTKNIVEFNLVSNNPPIYTMKGGLLRLGTEEAIKTFCRDADIDNFIINGG